MDIIFNIEGESPTCKEIGEIQNKCKKAYPQRYLCNYKRGV